MPIGCLFTKAENSASVHARKPPVLTILAFSMSTVGLTSSSRSRFADREVTQRAQIVALHVRRRQLADETLHVLVLPAAQLLVAARGAPFLKIATALPPHVVRHRRETVRQIVFHRRRVDRASHRFEVMIDSIETAVAVLVAWGGAVRNSCAMTPRGAGGQPHLAPYFRFLGYRDGRR